MPRTTFLVPRGAQAAAVRRAATGARVVEVLAGAAAASALPDFENGETVIVLGLCGALRTLRPGDGAIYGHGAGGARALPPDAGLIGALGAGRPGAPVVNAGTVKRVVTWPPRARCSRSGS